MPAAAAAAAAAAALAPALTPNCDAISELMLLADAMDASSPNSILLLTAKLPGFRSESRSLWCTDADGP